MGRAHCVPCFNEGTLCVLSVLCVSETSCLPPLAEPSVYLPSRKWHQQPGPEDMWQCRLPCTGLSAGVTEPTQKSKFSDFVFNIQNLKWCLFLFAPQRSFPQGLNFMSASFPQPSTSSVTSDEKVDYVQVDKEKTQALQSTMQEWTDVRQSTEPAKGVKS